MAPVTDALASHRLVTADVPVPFGGRARRVLASHVPQVMTRRNLIHTLRPQSAAAR